MYKKVVPRRNEYPIKLSYYCVKQYKYVYALA